MLDTCEMASPCITTRQSSIAANYRNLWSHLEPLAAELLGSSIVGVCSFNGDAVVVGVLLAVGERVARDGDESGLLGVQDADTLHVRGLERPTDAASRRVDVLYGRR